MSKYVLIEICALTIELQPPSTLYFTKIAKIKIVMYTKNMDGEKKEEEKNVRYVVEEVGTPEVKTEDNKEESKSTVATQEIKPEIKEEESKKEEIKDEKVNVVEKPKVKSSFNSLWILIPGMLLLGLLIGGIFAYVFGLQKISNPPDASTQETQNTTVEPTESPLSSPTSSPSVDLSKYKVKILNGSGIKGEAGKVQALLEDGGFSILSTGNATTYDYTKTQITLKTGIDPDFVTSLVTVLGKTYQVQDPKTISSQTNDITVIVGSLKAE